MTQEPHKNRELRKIWTCFVSTPDRDVIAAFEIDGRRYTDADQFRRVYEEASAEMCRRRAGWEWELRSASPTEPRSRLPTWEEYRVDLGARHPMPGAG